MSKNHHKNVLSYYANFVSENELWLVMPLLRGGSLEHILRFKYKKGFKDEVLIASILKQVIEGI